MPRITETIGTGMTERAVVEFDWATPGDLDMQIAAGIESVDRSSFGRLSPRFTGQASRILSHAGLPFDAGKVYAVDDGGAWRETGELGPDTELSEESVPLAQAVLYCNYQADTPEGYAANVLMLLRQAQLQLAGSSMDEAMATAIELGSLITEASMKGIFERDFLTGEKVHEGGRKGHEQEHGTEEKKAAKWAKYVEAFDVEMSKRPGKRYRSKAYEIVAEVFEVHPITVRRAVERRDSESF